MKEDTRNFYVVEFGEFDWLNRFPKKGEDLFKPLPKLSKSMCMDIEEFVNSPFVMICADQLKKKVNIHACVVRYVSRQMDRMAWDRFYRAQTALWQACESGNVKKVKWLLEQGADVNLGECTNCAYIGGRYTYAEIRKKNAGIRSAAQAAIQGNSLACLLLILETGKLKESLKELLFCAVVCRAFSIIKFLMEKKKVAWDDSFWDEAVWNSALVKYLIDKRHVSWDRKLWTSALRAGRYKVVEFLLERGAVVESDDLFWIMEGEESADSKLMELLLTKGKQNVNTQNYKGQTLLFIAARLGDDKMFETLLKAGGDVTIKDRQGRNVYEFLLAESKCSAEWTKKKIIRFKKLEARIKNIGKKRLK